MRKIPLTILLCAALLAQAAPAALAAGRTAAPICYTSSDAGGDAGTSGDIDPSEAGDPPVGKFDDVLDGAWYTDFIYEAAAAGWVNGYGNGLFQPENYITWGEALKVVLSRAGYAAENTEGHWANGWLKVAIDNNFLETDVVLNDYITRLEFCRLLGKAMGLAESTEAAPFADTDDGYIVLFASKGIVNGMDAVNGIFGPDAQLQRCQACKILSLSGKADFSL